MALLGVSFVVYVGVLSRGYLAENAVFAKQMGRLSVNIADPGGYVSD